MEKPFVDLHIHSFYSDGSMSPEQITESANQNGVGTLAVADHDILDGSILIRKLCKESGLHYIPAVEIDALDGETNFHILAYGFDINDSVFGSFISHTRFLLDELSVKLVELMQSDYSSVSLDDYMEYSYDKRCGGWKALHYFMEQGLTTSLKGGIKLYSEYGMSYDKSGYSTIAAIAYRIKSAGGYSVLAHPGELIDHADINQFEKELRRIISCGINGIECYYPSHSEAVTQKCIELCNEYDLLITAGSDCHGTFGKTRVGEMNIPVNRLRLKDLAVNEY